MTNCHRHLVSKVIVFAYCPKTRTHNQLSNKIVSILSQEDQEGLGTFLKIFILTQIGTHWLLLTILRSNQAFQQSQVRKKDFLDKTQNFHFLWSSWDIRYLLKRYHLLELGSIRFQNQSRRRLDRQARIQFWGVLDVSLRACGAQLS